MLIIGNANGDTEGYLDVIKQSKEFHSILLGGAGMKMGYDYLLDYPLDALHHSILLSYNDYYPYKDHVPFTLPDWGILEYGNKKIGFIRGAKHPISTCNRVMSSPRQEEEDYGDLCFPTQEQLNEYHFMYINEVFAREEVKILLTTDIPQSLYEQITGKIRSTHTRRQLDNVLFNLTPHTWIFNYNISLNTKMFDTNFIGLSSLQTKTILPYE